MEKVQTESSLAKPNTNDEMNIELSEEFLIKLRSNAYYGMFDEDMIDHIAKVLEMLDLIKIPNVDSHRLHMKAKPTEKHFQVGDKTFNVSDIYKFHSEDVNEGKHLRTCSSKERGNDDDRIKELSKEYMDHLERGKSKGVPRSNVTAKHK
nr:transposon Ty3-I Gag-Pol polyprotein [Tanacetum cinerariifolium]